MRFATSLAGSRTVNDACVIRSFVDPFTKDIPPQKVRKKTKAVAPKLPTFTSDISESNMDAADDSCDRDICAEGDAGNGCVRGVCVFNVLPVHALRGITPHLVHNVLRPCNAAGEKDGAKQCILLLFFQCVPSGGMQ